jgi:nitrate reductase gamma subunit
LNVLDIAFIFIVYIIGTLLSLIITGLLVNRLVIKKVMANEDVKDLIRLFREGKEQLRQILENQKH